ncbi:MAG TPA: site-specific DNA-methyltransferase [Puia sp.]|nr:site-specific DNA-methyltransferase [Puia sp.]
MKPVYKTKDGRVAIYRQDAVAFLRGLSSASVDVIVTDPAYSGMNQRLKLGSGKIIGRYKEAGQNGAKWFEEFHDTEENYRAFLEECYRVLRPDRHIYLMFDSYSLLTLAPIVRDVFDVKNILCWDKANIGLGHYFRRRHEFIVFASKGKRALNCKSIPDVWKIRRILKAGYPTQKPTEVFELMLRGSADAGSVVCDPFMGSGSAAIAALRWGCKFAGCDISPRAMEYSRKRIEGWLKGKGDIFQPASQVSDDESITQLLAAKPRSRT